MPAALMFSTPEKNFAMEKAIFSNCRFHLFADTNAQILPAQIEHCGCEGWLTGFPTDMQVLGGVGQTIAFPFQQFRKRDDSCLWQAAINQGANI